MNSFGYRRMEYAIKVVSGAVKDDTLFAFVSRADQDEKGNVDYTDREQHRKANPSYGVTIRPDDIYMDSLQAQNDPQQRKDFLSRSLNIYTAAMLAYFDIQEFRLSDRKYQWSLTYLAKLPIDWYGGADLSRMHDLTAAALYGNYNGIDICVTHAFFPRTAALKKAEEDDIPLFGWEQDGWLTRRELVQDDEEHWVQDPPDRAGPQVCRRILRQDEGCTLQHRGPAAVHL